MSVFTLSGLPEKPWSLEEASSAVLPHERRRNILHAFIFIKLYNRDWAFSPTFFSFSCSSRCSCYFAVVKIVAHAFFRAFFPRVNFRAARWNPHHFFLHSSLLSSYYWTKAVVTGVVRSSPRFLPSIFHRACGVQQSQLCSSIFHRVLLTHALALSASKPICAQEKVSTDLYDTRVVCTRDVSNRLTINFWIN